MSFQEELEKLVVNAALNGAYEDAGQRVLSRDVISTALTSIINLVDKELPEKQYTPLDIGNFDAPKRAKIMTAITNYNQAIDDMRKRLKGGSDG